MGKYLGIIGGVFAAICLLIFIMSNNALGAYDTTALYVGNAILAVLSIVAYFMVTAALKRNNPNAFIRAKMGSTMLRFFLCVVIFVGYVYLHGKEGIKPTVFMFLGMYVIYSIVESAILARKGRLGK